VAVTPMNQPASPSRPLVAVDHLRKSFATAGGEKRALDDVSMTIDPGEFVVIVGPSGCGKTTLLRCVAGLETGDGGSIAIAGETVFSNQPPRNTPSERRRLSMVFQSYALWPHKSVIGNVAFPLRCQGIGKGEAVRRAGDMLATLDLGEYAHQYPAQLSGGQQQRVALARALVAGSRLVLFDEPLSNLDAQIRDRIRGELGELHRRHGFASLYVTHDQAEAMALADKLVVMRKGRILQLGRPRDIYQRPNSIAVARFVGQANIICGSVKGRIGGGLVIETGHGDLAGSWIGDGSVPSADRVAAIIRPEHIAVAPADPAPGGTLRGTIEASRFLGGWSEAEVRVGENLFVVRRAGDQLLEPGQAVALSMRAEDVTLVAPDDAP
jgi:iron(III) transport system ATP-binding protein